MKNKKVFIIVVVFIFALAVGILYIKKSPENNQTTTEPNPSISDKIDLSPATEEDRKAADQNKEENVKRQDVEKQTQTGGTKNVTPTITSAGIYDNQLEVSSFVSGVIEEGTCKLTATHGSSKVERQVTSVKNATNTSCPLFTIPRSEFSATGDWSLTISYSSASAQGSSAVKTISIN